jgi:hypothetical protein
MSRRLSPRVLLDSWRRKSPIGVPVVDNQAIIEQAKREASLARPFGNSHCAPPPCNASILARIVGLLRQRRPSNIAGFVIPVYVDSIKGVFPGRALAYVRKERGEVVSPFVAHLDPAAAVVGPSLIRTVIATSFRVAPRLVFRSLCLSVRALARRRRLAVQATTASDVAGAELIAGDLMCVPAVATANPLLAFVGVRQCNKATEALVGDVNQWASHSRRILSHE